MWAILRQAIHGHFEMVARPEVRDDWRAQSEQIQAELLQILGKALCIRQVDAGSCNACELEIHALNNPYYNIEGMGIKFVASPRHADMLLVTGPVTQNMALALKQAYDATPDPKLVVAMGECACTGGMFADSYACVGAVENVIPVDVQIPGCPPPPLEILRGILSAVTIRSAQEELLKQAYDATPDPKLVVAMGECACTGGMFADSYACVGAVENVIPVDVQIPGCPPPLEILRGILSAVVARTERENLTLLSSTLNTNKSNVKLDQTKEN